jgi:hypothetical protein
MSRSVLLALIVFVTVIVIGLIDIVSTARVQRIAATLESQIGYLRNTAATNRLIFEAQLDGLNRRCVITEREIRRINAHLDHPLPRPERVQPTPIFR